MRRLVLAAGLAIIPLVGGCAFYPRAQNPLPGVFRVAVVDFANKTNGAEGVDTAKITEIFASELQKIPTYEVVPVQEVREVLGPVRIDTNQPQIAFEIARALHAQAVIVGAVTEYNGHYPPRIGLHCEMYAMVTGQPEAVVESPEATVERSGGPLAFLGGVAGKGSGDSDGDVERDRRKHSHCHHKCTSGGCKPGELEKPVPWPMRWWKRGLERTPDESAEPTPPEETPVPLEPVGPGKKGPAGPTRDFSPSNMPREGVEAPVRTVAGSQSEETGVTTAGHSTQDGDENWGPTLAPASGEEAPRGTAAEYFAGQIPDYRISVRQAVDPVPVVEPWVIRHSRVFDSTSHGLTRKLKDYYYFQDDIRGGDWQGYVLRNDDFNRFACNRMIYEMLEAAGGDWITLFGMRYAKPWEPWPPR